MSLRTPAWILLALAGCVPGTSVVSPPSPAEVPRLEARVDAQPGDVDSRVLLGAAYQDAGRTGEAIATLQGSEAILSGNPSAVLYLGLAYEDAGRFRDARGLYRRFLDTAFPDDGVRERLAGRIQLLRRQELARSVRDALAREQELADRVPAQGTVAVFPFVVGTEDPELEPLGRAVASLVLSDLARLDRLTVLERVGIDVLLNELALAESGGVDPTTAARSGRLLGARHVVQADLAGSREALVLDAAVVELQGGEESIAALDARGSLDGIFDMQKEILFDVVDALGITLTAAEREALSERATTNLMALLEYGRGLEDEAAGRWDAASAHYRSAASLDPAFSAASQAAAELGAAAGAVGIATSQLLLELTLPDLSGLVEELGALVNFAGIRDPAQELLGTEGTGAGSLSLEIILVPPGGGEDR